MKASELPSNQLVDLYIQIRDRRALRKAEYENADAGDKHKQEKIEGILMVRFHNDGVESIRTDAGTAYVSARSAFSVADRDAFRKFVEDNNAWELVEMRAAKTACTQFKEEHNDLPPGLNYSEVKVINVRRS